MEEPAFNGTVLEGHERRYTIINECDVDRYCKAKCVLKMHNAPDEVRKQIEDGRVKDGKKPHNSYIVINIDEPYIDEIIEIMKCHDQWNN